MLVTKKRYEFTLGGLKIQIKSAKQKECDYSDDLFAEALSVCCQDRVKVNPRWLSICKEERNQTTDLLEQITSFSNLQKTYKQVRRNGGGSGVDQKSIKYFRDWFSKNYQELQNQILQEDYQPQTPNIYGSRPKHNAHQSLLESQKIVKTGKKIIVDLDLAKFFDEVNHQRLMWMLGTRIGDKRLLKLIERI
jgi:RNA-directed DNA polymerase